VIKSEIVGCLNYEQGDYRKNHMTCKGICIRHKAMKPVGTGRYSTGQKRCQVCEIFLKWDGLWCPCCGYRLRTRPRNLKYKAKLRTRKKIDEYRIALQQQEQPPQQPAVQAHKKTSHT
jgi:predicted amidophosphoribosyltransferase